MLAMKCCSILLIKIWSHVIFYLILKSERINGKPEVRNYIQRKTFVDTNLRIANGDIAEDGEFPYVVALFRAFRKVKHHAAGTLVTAAHVLTACHVLAVESENGFEIDVNNLALPLEIEVLAGTVDLKNTDGKGVKRSAKLLKVHPLCNRTAVSMEYDYGMILLEKPYDLEKGRIEILKFPNYKCIAFVNELVAKSDTCVSMGWGLDEYYDEPDLLSKITTNLRAFDWCEKTIRDLTYEEPAGPDKFSGLVHVCAVGVKNESTTCPGDSGGPIVCQDGKVLVGIVSFGPGSFSCGRNKAPGVFARVDVAQDFISEFIESTTMNYSVFKYNCKPFRPVNGGSIVTLDVITTIIMASFPLFTFNCPSAILMNGWNFLLFCFVSACAVVSGWLQFEQPLEVVKLDNAKSQNKYSDEALRIAYGDDANEGDFPYLVALFLISNNHNRTHHGSGTIITDSHVLTACHLLASASSEEGPAEIDVNHLIKPSIVEILAGTVDSRNEDGKGITRRAKRLMVHPLCERSEISLTYDYGMILLKTPINIVKGRIEPLKFPKYKCLSLVNRLVARSDSCVTMGWGHSRVNSSHGVLKKITIQLKEFEWCQLKITASTQRQEVGPDLFNDLVQVCGIGVKNGTTICGGDGGGALMCQNGKVMVGIVSYGPGVGSCGKDKSAGVFARVDVAQDFIANHQTRAGFVVQIASKMNDSPPPQPTVLIGERHKQMLIVAIFYMMCFLQKNMMSFGVVAMSDTQQDTYPVVEFSTAQKGILISVSYYGYLASSLPMSLLVSKYGPLKVLSISGGILLGLITCFMPLVAIYMGYEALCAARIIQGVFFGCIIPCTYKMISNWVVPKERETFSWVFLGVHGSSLIYPLLGVLAASPGGWPSIFYVVGIMGIVLGLVALYFGVDEPSVHQSITKQEKDFIEYYHYGLQPLKKKLSEVPWIAILTSIPFWASIFVQASERWLSNILNNFFPTFLRGVYGFNTETNGVLSSLPGISTIVFTILFSFLGNKLIARVSLNFSRRFWACIGNFVPCCFLVILATMDIGAAGAITLISLIMGSYAANLNSVYINSIDLSPNWTSILSGISFIFANASSILANTYAGFAIRDEHDIANWQELYLIITATTFAGGTIFLLFGSTKIQPWNNLDRNSKCVEETKSKIDEC
ncbi:hypothetical protein GE061_015737 [Apolygus lucorum]|uniref:Peptidase S1 domain-containing protein n=1 Tax=Apolygus lucorum TaxID=248454 RepID=A0A8S9XLR5_APOLU|nr:hypothetical protein GE061_015737 [Apolygus lucorum]